MRIVLSGGTGFIGKPLVRSLVQAGHRVVVLSRHPESVRDRLPPGVELEYWDGRSSGPARLDGADAVINLAGEPIGARRWTERQKARIISSRVDGTRGLVEAISRASRKPTVLINASAVGYYGNIADGDATEQRGAGTGFLAETCARWEAEALNAEQLGVRVVMLRTGIVLGEDGGTLRRMIVPFKLFVGGVPGSGRQWIPWIHRDDVIGAVIHLLSRPDISGPVNLAAPESLTMRQFCHSLGRWLRRPTWIPMPSFLLRLLLGEMAVIVLDGQRVIPGKLLQSGYKFRFPTLDTALRGILA